MEAGGWRLEGGGWRVEAGGWRLEGGGWRLEGGGWRVEAGGWRLEGGVGGGQKIGLKMEADHDWSPDTRLQGCAGSLVADM